MSANRRSTAILSICRRGSVVAFSVTKGGEILIVERVKAVRETKRQTVRRRAQRLAKAYRVGTIVLEKRLRAWVGALPDIRFMTLADAKSRLTGSPTATHQELFQLLMRGHPKLRRFIAVLPNAKVEACETWRTTLLLAIALAFAATTIYSLR